MLVVDASVLVTYLVGGESSEQARERLLSGGTLCAPHLVDAEVGHVLRRSVSSGELRSARATAALHDLADLPLVRAGHRGLLERAWALRANVTFYDGLYVALAETLAAPLVTLDGRLARASGIKARIEVVA